MALTRKEVARLLNMVCGMTLDEMKQKFDDPLAPAIEKLFIKTVVDGLKKDAVNAAEFILNRTVGKPKEEVELTTLSTTFERLDGTKETYTIGPAGEGRDE